MMKKKVFAVLASAMMLATAVVTPVKIENSFTNSAMVSTLEANAASYTTGNYTVTAKSGVCVRCSNSTSSAKAGAAAYGKDCVITKVSGSWGYTNRIVCTNGVRSGWIYLPNLTKGTPYKITASSGVNLRSGAGTSYAKLTAIPKNTIIVVTNFKVYSNSYWGKVTYNGKTGWICLNYAMGLSSNGQCV